MTEVSEPRRVINECQSQQGQERDPAEIVRSQGAALGQLMKAAGVTSCKQGTVAAVTLIGGAGGSFAEGCEQLAAFTSALDASQRVFQCAFTRLIQTDRISAVNSLSAKVRIGTGVAVRGCSIQIAQRSGMRVAKYSQLTNDIKEAMTAQLENSMQGFLENIQNEEKQGLFSSSDGQKAFGSFTQTLRSAITNKAFKDIVQQTLESYDNRAQAELEIDPYATFGYVTNTPGPIQPCIEITQDFVTQVVSQTMILNALKLVFDSSEANDMKTFLQNGQYRKVSGFTLPDFGALAGIAVVVVIIVIVMSVKKGGGEGGGGATSILAGKPGIVLGVILLILGIGLIIAGLVLLLMKKSLILTIGMFVGGAIVGIIGLVMFLRAKSQQVLFQQQLQVTRANSGNVSPPLKT